MFVILALVEPKRRKSVALKFHKKSSVDTGSNLPADSLVKRNMASHDDFHFGTDSPGFLFISFFIV